MNNLSIKLTGEIQNSNFEEWKSDLVEQLKQVDTELSTDSDFVAATKHAKSFKAAEKALKKAKESALSQAADINALFEAIDSVAAQTREVRLTLERQIKERKKQIKQEYLEKGEQGVRDLLDQQSADFKLVDQSAFLDEDLFEDAIKGKASTKGLQKGIATALSGIEQQITAKAVLVKANAAAIDSLAGGYKILFQDRATLLDLAKDKLDSTIDERIKQFNEEQARTATSIEEIAPENAADNELDVKPASEQETAPDTDAAFSDFTVHINLNSRQADAEQLVEQLKQEHLENPFVKSVELHPTVQ